MIKYLFCFLVIASYFCHYRDITKHCIPVIMTHFNKVKKKLGFPKSTTESVTVILCSKRQEKQEYNVLDF